MVMEERQVSVLTLCKLLMVEESYPTRGENLTKLLPWHPLDGYDELLVRIQARNIGE